MELSVDEKWFVKKSFWSKWRNAYLKDANFKKFWKKTNKENLDKDLVDLVNYYISSKSFEFSSRFWNLLNIRHINQIIRFGIEHFATTVALNYFTMLTYDDVSIQNLLDYINNAKILPTEYSNELFKKQINIDFTHSVNHNIILNLLYAYIKHSGYNHYLKRLEKNNFLIEKVPNIKIDKMLLTQDKLNSILEFINIKKILNNIGSSSLNILEIGAGSGRTTETIISLLDENKKIKYVIADIPPALYINFLRMKNNYPNKKIALALNVESEESLKKIYNDNDIILILPHQLNYFNNKDFDITIAIDCLHEMDKKIIKFYMDTINRISNYLYFKILNETHVPYSFNNFLSAQNKKDYQIKSSWELILDEKSTFPSNFSEFGYKII
jgi:putative sugar O-methyltransferase